MKLSDLISVDNGIFAAIAKTPFWETTFTGYDAETLDLDFLGSYGERAAAPIVKTCGDVDKLARVLLSRYGDSWTRQHTALMSEYDVTRPYQVKETTKETRESKLENLTNDKTANKVSGFDSDISVDSDNSESNRKTNQDGTDTISREYSKDGVAAGVSIPSLIDAEIRLRRKNFISLVMGDIKDFTTLAIY